MLLLALTALALAQDPSSSEAEGDEDSDDTVVVEGERDDVPDPSRVPAVVTVVPIDDSLPATHDLGEVVDGAAGATVQRLGGLGDYSAVSIRGSSFRSVTVCLDGIPLNPEGSSAVDLSELPLRSFERVEIYRGNAPARLGTPGMGGVVDLISAQEPPPESVSLSVGSWGSARISGSAGASTQGMDLLLAADALHSRGDFTYFTDGGTTYNTLDDHRRTRQNNTKDQVAVHGRLRSGGLTVQDAFMWREAGLPGHGDAPASSASLGLTRNAAAVQAQGARGLVSGSARVFSLIRQESLHDPLGELGLGSQVRTDLTHSTGLHLHGAWATLPVLGASLSARRDGWTGQQDQRGRYAANAALDAAWWSLSDRLLVAPVLQGTVVVDGEQVQWLPSPRLGVLLRPTERLSLKANGGRYGRPPDLTELFGDRGAAKGNAELRPERGWQADAGGRWQPGAASFVEAYGFWNEATDLIVWMHNAQRVSVPQNVGRARVRGVEAAAQATLLEHVELSGSLTRTWSTTLSGSEGVRGRPLPSVPAWELSSRAAWVQGEWLRAGHSWSFTDGEFYDATGTHRAAPRSIHGLFARVQPWPRLPSLEVDVLNLFDNIAQVVPRNPLAPEDGARVVQPLTDFVGYPLPGRTLMLTLRWEGP